MDDPLREWRAFVAVAEHGSFTRAASVLGLGQPQLSRQLLALERRLALQLLDRTSRQTRLTGPGRDLLEPARQLLSSHDALLAHARQITRGDRASLRLGASSQVLASFVAPFVGRFAREHPGLDLHLVEGTVDPLLVALQQGALDYAVLAAQVQPPLESVALYRTDIQLVSPLQERERTGRVVEVKSLHGQPLLLLTRASMSRRLFDAACVQAGVQPDLRLESENAQALLELVHQGYGVAVLPSTAQGHTRSVRRQCLQVAGQRLSTTMHLAWNSEAYHPRGAVLLFEALLQFAREHC